MASQSSFEDEMPNQMINARRSANYQPSWWDYSLLQTLPNSQKEKVSDHLVEKLVQEVRHEMNVSIIQRQLDLIEVADRLGVASLFHEEIYRILSMLSLNNCKGVIPCGLRTTSICFCLLRRFGFQISEGIFDAFMDSNQKTFKSSLCYDVLGLISLYNASKMAFHGEQKMDVARSFALKHLIEEKKKKKSLSDVIETAVTHALDLPLHQRIPWMEARLYIDMYELEDDMNPTLLQLAKIHFKEVQSIHQQELKQVASWWTKLNLEKIVTFSRNRLMECLFYVVGIVHDPDYGFCREKLTQVGMLIAYIDDVYDVYGSLEELELFTQIIDRWDINEIIKLPNYMRICFSTLNDTISELASQLPLNDRLEAIPHLKRVWVDLLKTFLIEAKWLKNRYIPTLKEYLSNATISISGHVILVHTYILLKCKVTKETLEQLQIFPNIIRLPSLIFRLYNDLATSSVEQERGEVATSIQCYMNEEGASEEEARLHISTLISDAWKDMNKESLASSNPLFPQRYIDACINLARMASFMYQHGDGFSSPGHHIKASIMSLLIT